MSVPQRTSPVRGAGPGRPRGFLDVVRAEGCRLWDTEGRTYLDGTASLWYCAAGHGRQEIIDAVTAQMAELEAYHTFGAVHQPAGAATGRRLMELEPIAGARVLFTNSGSEAIDSALKLARAGTGPPARAGARSSSAATTATTA